MVVGGARRDRVAAHDIMKLARRARRRPRPGDSGVEMRNCFGPILLDRRLLANRSKRGHRRVGWKIMHRLANRRVRRRMNRRRSSLLPAHVLVVASILVAGCASAPGGTRSRSPSGAADAASAADAALPRPAGSSSSFGMACAQIRSTPPTRRTWQRWQAKGSGLATTTRPTPPSP